VAVNVGRSPWTAADALVGLQGDHLARASGAGELVACQFSGQPVPLKLLKPNLGLSADFAYPCFRSVLQLGMVFVLP
jgi:hypothetical protein